MITLLETNKTSNSERLKTQYTTNDIVNRHDYLLENEPKSEVLTPKITTKTSRHIETLKQASF